MSVGDFLIARRRAGARRRTSGGSGGHKRNREELRRRIGLGYRALASGRLGGDGPRRRVTWTSSGRADGTPGIAQSRVPGVTYTAALLVLY